jgi:hypothetical protein
MQTSRGRHSSRAVLFLAVIVTLVLPQSSLRAAQTLPGQISDAAFWQMVVDFSEAGGSFVSENFVSNERGYQNLIPRLQAALKPGGVYLGVGPEQNFQYIAALKPRMAFIIDIRRQNLVQHLMYKAAFEMAADRADFLSIIFSRQRPEGLSAASTANELFEKYRLAPRDEDLARKNLEAVTELLIHRHGFKLTPEDGAVLGRVITVFSLYGTSLSYSSNIGGLTGGGANNVAYEDIMTLTDFDGTNRSFLAAEEEYRYLKELQEKNLIVPLVGDFGGPKAIRAVGQYLRDHEATVMAFYLSNVEQYLFQMRFNAPNGGAANFYQNAATLPLDEFSAFIRSGNSQTSGRGGLTPMMSSMMDVITAVNEGRVRSHADVLAMSKP